MGHFVSAFNVNLVNQVPVGIAHLDEALVTQDTGVIDDNVNTAKVVHGALNDFLAVDHVVRVGNRSTASGFDFFNNLECCIAVGAFTLGAATQIVNDDFGAMLGEQQGVRAANTAASAGYDDNFVVKTNIAHGVFPSVCG